MEVLHLDFEKEISFKEPISACIGYFDGLHKGHQALVNKAKEMALKTNSKSCLITFFPDPKDVITKTKHKHIQNFYQRLKIMETLGLDYCIVCDFSENLCKLSKEEFFDKFLNVLNLKCLVCGFDFHYAYKGSGDYHSLIEASKGKFDVEVIDSVNYLDEKISSTRVREAILNGDIELVNELLGYDYFLNGVVVHGKAIGHKIGFPTANLLIDQETLILKEGVYIGYTKVDNIYYKSMVNIGRNQTIALNNQRTIEAHIVDYNGNLYGKEIIMYFNHKIRDGKKFDSLEELKNQLTIDIEKARAQDERKQFIL